MSHPVTFDVFKLERYFALYEFTVKHQLSCSDGEALTMSDLLDHCDDQCRELWQNLSLAYTESQGHPLLRAEVAARYKNITADDVIMAVPQEAIFMAMNVLAQHFIKDLGIQNPHVIAMFPGYQSLYDDPKAFGCSVSKWEAEYVPSTGWQFNIDKLTSLITPNTKLLVVNTPHNPTGWYPSPQQWQDIIDLCEKHHLYLFSDEMYSMLPRHDGEQLNPSACDMYDKAVSLAGVSKSFCCPGLRLGWLITRNQHILSKISEFKDYTTICSPAPVEILALMALRQTARITERLSAIAKASLDAADKLFNEFPDLFEWRRPVAGTTAFVKIKGWLSNYGNDGATEFADLLRKEAKILIVPAKLFDYPDHYFRLGYGRKNVPEILDILRDFIIANKPK